MLQGLVMSMSQQHDLVHAGIDRASLLCQVLRRGWLLQGGIPTSLLKLGPENVTRAVKMFGGVQKFMGFPSPDSGAAEVFSDAVRMEVAAKLMHQAVKRTELRDELYMQVGMPSSVLCCLQRTDASMSLTIISLSPFNTLGLVQGSLTRSGNLRVRTKLAPGFFDFERDNYIGIAVPRVG